MRISAFVLDRPAIARILAHTGEPAPGAVDGGGGRCVGTDTPGAG